jgi:hypothetical protein
VIDTLLRRVLPPRILRLALALCSVLAGALLFSGAQAFAAGAAPVIASESASNITEHDATLEAQLNPNGLETAYEFQIDTNGSYNYPKSACPLGECDALVLGEPLPSGLVEPQPQNIPAGTGNQAVSLDLAGIGATLQSATTYHYRVIASNGGGPTIDGPDQTFTTPSQSTSPSQQGTEPSSPSVGAGLVAPQLPGDLPAIAAPLLSGLRSVNKPKANLRTDAQKLAKALRVCDKKPKKQRSSCKKQAEHKYGNI